MFKIVVGVFLSLITVFSCAASGQAQDAFTYRVKGEIKAIPPQGAGGSDGTKEIIVKHEPIPDYRDEAGNIVGMAAMTMPFYLSKDLKTESVAVGDRVELVVEQRLKPRFSEVVVSLKKLNGELTR
jgi:Cu/Ag efflux protein CusF